MRDVAAPVLEQHVPLIETGQDKGGDNPVETRDIFGQSGRGVVSLGGQIDGGQKGNPETATPQPLDMDWNHRRPARPGEADDVQQVGAPGKGAAEQGRSHVALALLVDVDQQHAAVIDQMTARGQCPGNALAQQNSAIAPARGDRNPVLEPAARRLVDEVEAAKPKRDYGRPDHLPIAEMEAHHNDGLAGGAGGQQMLGADDRNSPGGP